jgi:hypothetical protein
LDNEDDERDEDVIAVEATAEERGTAIAAILGIALV